jgi:hypothetical protein
MILWEREEVSNFLSMRLVTEEVMHECCNKTNINNVCKNLSNILNPDRCVQYTDSYCSHDPAGPKCKAWCKSNPNKCSVPMIKYCSTLKGKRDPFCACMISPAARLGFKPRRVDNNCKLDTSFVLPSSLTCPMVSCADQAKLISGGVKLAADLRLEQNCSSLKKSGVEKLTSDYIISDSSNIIMFLLFVVFIIIIGIIIRKMQTKNIVDHSNDGYY